MLHIHICKYVFFIVYSYDVYYTSSDGMYTIERVGYSALLWRYDVLLLWLYVFFCRYLFVRPGSYI